MIHNGSLCSISSSHGGEYDVQNCLLGGGSTHLWNVGRQLFYTAEHPRRQSIPIFTTYLISLNEQRTMFYRKPNHFIEDFHLARLYERNWRDNLMCCEHGPRRKHYSPSNLRAFIGCSRTIQPTPALSIFHHARLRSFFVCVLPFIVIVYFVMLFSTFMRLLPT
jgi:hypothetical protein